MGNGAAFGDTAVPCSKGTDLIQSQQWPHTAGVRGPQGCFKGQGPCQVCLR